MAGSVDPPLHPPRVSPRGIPFLSFLSPSLSLLSSFLLLLLLLFLFLPVARLFFPSDGISAEPNGTLIWTSSPAFVLPLWVYRYTRDHCFAPVRPNSRTRASSLLAIQIGGNFLSAFLTSCIGPVQRPRGFCVPGERIRRNSLPY